MIIVVEDKKDSSKEKMQCQNLMAWKIEEVLSIILKISLVEK